MADESPTSNQDASRHTFWLAVAGMACLLLLALAALGMSFFLGRNQSPAVTVSQVNNANQGGTPAATAPAALNRPDKPSETAASRSAQVQGTVKLPGAGDKTVREGAALSVRADTQSPPFYSTLTPASKVHLRVAPQGPTGLSGAVPFRVRQFQPGPDGRVPGVLAAVPPAGQEAQYSFLPDVTFLPAASKGARLSIEISGPRKTSTVNELRAPKGFQFFVAEIRASNLGDAEIPFQPDMFEIRDSEQVAYLPNPELLGQGFPARALAAGASASFMTATLVPDDAALALLAALEPGGAVLTLPLAPK